MLCVYFNYFENITAFLKILYEEDHELFQWFQKQFPAASAAQIERAY